MLHNAKGCLRAAFYFYEKNAVGHCKTGSFLI